MVWGPSAAVPGAGSSREVLGVFLVCVGLCLPRPHVWGVTPWCWTCLCSAGDVAGLCAGALPLTGERCPWETLCLPQKNPFPGSQPSGGTGSWDNGLKNENIGAPSLQPWLLCVLQNHCCGGVGVSPAMLHALGSCFFPQAGNPLTFRRGKEPWVQLALCRPAASGRGISGWGDRATAPCTAQSQATCAG